MNGGSDSSPQPGWYADPEYPGYIRYFDGTAWTEHRQPALPPPLASQQSCDPVPDSDSAPFPHMASSPNPYLGLGRWEEEAPLAQTGRLNPLRTQNKRTISLAVAAAVVAVVAVVALVAALFFFTSGRRGGEDSDDVEAVSQPAREAVAPEPEEPEQPEEPESAVPAVDVLYLPEVGPTLAARYRWRGGALISVAESKAEPPTVVAWMPGMADAVTCELDLLEPGESLTDDNSQGSSFDIGALLNSEEPRAFVIFSVVDHEDRLNSIVEVYVQPLDLETCGLGSRVSVTGPLLLGELNSAGTAATQTFLGATESILAFAPLGMSGGDSKAIGYDVETGKVVWETSDIVQMYDSDDGMQSAFHAVPSDARDTALFSVYDGSLLARDVRDPQGIGPDHFIYNKLDDTWEDAGEGGYYSCSVSAAECRLVEESFPGLVRASSDGQGTPLLVGPSWDPDYGGGIVSWNAAGEVRGIVTNTQLEGARASFAGFTHGHILLETADELIVVDMQGKQVGSPVPLDEYPYVQVADYVSGENTWTLWEHSRSGDGSVVVSRNGILPKGNGG